MLSTSIPMLSKVCYIHVVLSALYQEKMGIKEKDVEDLTVAEWPWSHCIIIQCIKREKVVTKTAELLTEVGCNEEGNFLKGKLVYIV